MNVCVSMVVELLLAMLIIVCIVQVSEVVNNRDPGVVAYRELLP